MKTLRARRKELGLTQPEMAEKVGVSVTALRHWEQGHRVPTLAYLHAIERGYEIDIHDIADFAEMRPDARRKASVEDMKAQRQMREEAKAREKAVKAAKRADKARKALEEAERMREEAARKLAEAEAAVTD